MDCQILQDDKNSLAQWEPDWQMKFNVAKCHSMRVTRHPPDKHIQFEYKLHQQRLEHVQSAKYLGLTITDDLDWGQHISEISAKAAKTAVVRASASGLEGCGFAPRPRHTKGVKNGTGSSLADARNKRVVLGRYKNAGRYLLLVMSQ